MSKARYSGLRFPKIFDTTKRSVVVTDIDKMKANIFLLLSQQIDMLLFNPQTGTDLESILFADDVSVTRDFVFTFVNESVLRDMPDVELRDVVIQKRNETLILSLHFNYKKGSVDFDVDYSMKGVAL